MSLRRGVLIGVVSLALSCGLVLGIQRPVPEPDPDAAPAGPIDPCTHVQPPLPPSGADASSESKSYWLAGERVIVPLFADAGVKSGIDLDNSCTCGADLRDGGPSCETRPRALNCDFDGGIDDAVSALAASFPVGKLFDPGDSVNRLIREGSQSLLFYIDKYNGEANDPDVGLNIIGSGGLYSDLGCNDLPRGRPSRGKPLLDPDAPGEQYEPAWDGCDRWSPDQGLTLGKYPDVAPTNTHHAYVSDWVLVGSIETTGFTVLGASMRVADGRFVARLSKIDTGFAMEGFVTGRMPFSALVTFAGKLETDEGSRQPLCTSDQWKIVSPLLCTARDIMEDPSRDGKGDPCDATSVAIGFTARSSRASDTEHTRPDRVVDCDASVACP